MDVWLASTYMPLVQSPPQIKTHYKLIFPKHMKERKLWTCLKTPVERCTPLEKYFRRVFFAIFHAKMFDKWLPYIRLPITPNHYIFTLKMAIAKFAETLDNFQHSSRLIPESQSCTLSVACSLKTRRAKNKRFYVLLFYLKEDWEQFIEL
jgi:hypothetical protein